MTCPRVAPIICVCVCAKVVEEETRVAVAAIEKAVKEKEQEILTV